MVIKSGLYGPYIAYNGKNYRLPKGSKIEGLTYTECQRIIAKAKK
jgi:DNA topoisomerase-1